jgi:hypothetical protein
MRPHSEHTHYLLLLEHFVHEAMLDIDTPRIGALEITDQLLERRGILKRITD